MFPLHIPAHMQSPHSHYPIPVNGLQFWGKADGGKLVKDPVTGLVGSWGDEIGSGRAFSNVAGGYVFYSGSVQNGLPALYFNSYTGSVGRLTTANGFMSSSDPGEHFFVLKSAAPQGTINYSYFTAGNSGDTVHYPYSDDFVYDNFGSSLRFSWTTGSGAPMRAMGIYNVSAGGGFWTARLNGVQQTQTSFGTSWYTTWFIGCDATQALQFVGYIGEVLVYNRVLSSIERSQVYTYLKNRWGTP